MGTDKRERQKANRASRIEAAEEAARRARNRSRLITYGLLAAVVVAAIVGVAWLTSDDDDDSAVTGEFIYGQGECPAEDGSSEPRDSFDGPPPLCIDPSANHVAVFDTSEGEIRVDLDTANTPGTVNNFVTLARWGYYDDTTIFRTDPSIEIIQGGGESPTDPGPGYTISDEPAFELDATTGMPRGPYTYVPGQLVMARSQGFDSAGAQFFFTTGPNAALLDSSGTYVVFGTTDDAGLEVLTQIIGLHVDDPTSQLGGAPSRTVTINSVTIEVT